MDIKKLLVGGLFTIGLIIVLKMVGEKVSGVGALMAKV